MSNRTSKIKKSIALRVDPLYNTLVGSIICTVGITNGKTEEEMKSLFYELKRNSKELGDCVDSMMTYIWNRFGNKDNIAIRSKYILVYDANNIRTPMVTFTNDEGNLMPINPRGFVDTNILYLAAEDNESRDWVRTEYLYDTDGKEFPGNSAGD